jgi:hypothetical protein
MNAGRGQTKLARKYVEKGKLEVYVETKHEVLA